MLIAVRLIAEEQKKKKKKKAMRVCIPAAAALLLVAAPAPALSLRILLTNDDGIDSPGIQEMKDALALAGHEVHVYAPSDNASGSSASVKTLIKAEKVGPNEFKVSEITPPQPPDTPAAVVGPAPPASCVLLGLAEMDDEPDLVISGNNNGWNTGPFAFVSGTIGGARTGLSQGIPSIAGLLNLGRGASDEEVQSASEMAANYMVRLVKRLERTGMLAKLKKAKVGLKVGFPFPAPNGKTMVAKTGQFSPVGPTYTELEPGSALYRVDFEDNGLDPSQAPKKSEFALMGGGYVTILPIIYEIDMPIKENNKMLFKKLNKKLQPLKYP